MLAAETMDGMWEWWCAEESEVSRRKRSQHVNALSRWLWSVDAMRKGQGYLSVSVVSLDPRACASEDCRSVGWSTAAVRLGGSGGSGSSG